MAGLWTPILGKKKHFDLFLVKIIILEPDSLKGIEREIIIFAFSLSMLFSDALN